MRSVPQKLLKQMIYEALNRVYHERQQIREAGIQAFYDMVRDWASREYAPVGKEWTPTPPAGPGPTCHWMLTATAPTDSSKRRTVRSGSYSITFGDRWHTQKHKVTTTEKIKTTVIVHGKNGDETTETDVTTVIERKIPAPFLKALDAVPTVPTLPSDRDIELALLELSGVKIDQLTETVEAITAKLLSAAAQKALSPKSA